MKSEDKLLKLLVKAETAKLEAGFMVLAIPLYMRAGVVGYVIEGIRPSGFLQALFANTLVEAWRRADGVNRQRLGAWAEFVAEYVPVGARGSKSAVEKWIKIGGWQGAMATAIALEDTKYQPKEQINGDA